MRQTFPLLLSLSLLLASCITVAPQTAPTVDVSFVTSTLPPTRSLVSRPTATRTPKAGLTGTPTLEVTVPPDCKVVAVLVEDVTIPDGTQVAAGKSFTKTWKFKNTGTCPWSGYKVSFVSGDRMGAPDSSPVPQTLGGGFVDVSVDLKAPAADGTYTGFFELQDAEGKVVPIGLEKTFWVKIRVGAGGLPPTPPTPGGTVSPTQMTGGDCQLSTNPGFVSQLLALLNDQRAAAGVPALTLNAQLSAAAQAHSEDQACNNFISHTGSNGSSIQQRIAAAGYSSSYSLEIIAVGGPEDAMAQWNDDALHRSAILNRSVTEVGIGWADSPNSVYGGQFTVDLASP